MAKFRYFHWILTYHKPDLIFSSETVMTSVVIFIKVRITQVFQNRVDSNVIGSNCLSNAWNHLHMLTHSRLSTSLIPGPWPLTSSARTFTLSRQASPAMTTRKLYLSDRSLPLSNLHTLIWILYCSHAEKA